MTDDFRKHAWQGAREGAWLFYTHRIPLPTLDVHVIDHYQSVGNLLGFAPGPTDFSFHIPQAAHERVDALLRERGIGEARLAVIAPRGNWQTKRWPDEKSAAVARHFMSRGTLRSRWSDAPRERAVCEEIAAPRARRCRSHRRDDAERACGASPPRYHLRRQRFRADASRGRARPAGGRAVRAERPGLGRALSPRQRGVRAGVPCSPCYLRQLSECPNDHVCMTDVSAAAVIARVEDIVARLPARAETTAPPARPR